MGFIKILFTSLTLLLILPAVFSIEEYQKAGLEDHNKYREDHGVDPLKINEKLNDLAIKCAEYYTDKSKDFHSCTYKDKAKHGENIYRATDKRGGPTTHTKTAIKLWYEEIADYDWEKPNCTVGKGGKQVGHFTQLVWKGSKELGVGYFYFEKESISISVVVALYTPPGNWEKQERENVLPLKAKDVAVAPNHAPQWILVFLAATFFTLTCTTLQLTPM